MLSHISGNAEWALGFGFSWFFVSALSGVDLISVLIPLVVVRWLPTAVEQGVQLRADGLRCEFLRLSLAGVESASPEASGCMGRMNIRLKLTLGEAEERGNGNWESKW